MYPFGEVTKESNQQYIEAGFFKEQIFNVLHNTGNLNNKLPVVAPEVADKVIPILQNRLGIEGYQSAKVSSATMEVHEGLTHARNAHKRLVEVGIRGITSIPFGLMILVGETLHSNELELVSGLSFVLSGYAAIYAGIKHHKEMDAEQESLRRARRALRIQSHI